MGSKIKLSPAMQAAMWLAHKGYNYNIKQATRFALVRRDLLGNGGYDLTDAGRAWIAEQIEAAHIEALWVELDRAQRVSGEYSEMTERAERMLLRADEQVGIMLPRDLAEGDAIEAWGIWHANRVRAAKPSERQIFECDAIRAGYGLRELDKLAA